MRNIHFPQKRLRANSLCEQNVDYREHKLKSKKTNSVAGKKGGGEMKMFS